MFYDVRDVTNLFLSSLRKSICEVLLWEHKKEWEEFWKQLIKFIVDSFRYRELLQIKLNTEEHLHALLQMHNMTEIWRKITTNITFGAWRFGIWLKPVCDVQFAAWFKGLDPQSPPRFKFYAKSNVLLTKLDQSRWLVIDQVLVFACSWTKTLLRSITTKKHS